MSTEKSFAKIENEEVFIERLETMMEEYLSQIQSSKSIRSIPGIGVITTAGMIGEVGDWQYNSNRKRIIAA